MAESKTTASQKTTATTKIATLAASAESAAPTRTQSVAKESAVPNKTRRRQTTAEAPAVNAKALRQLKAESAAPKQEGKIAAQKKVVPAPKTPSTSTGSAAKRPKEAPKSALLAENTKAARSPRKLSKPEAGEIEHMIAEAAYYLAEKRNFAPGFEEQDWAVATAEVMERLKPDSP